MPLHQGCALSNQSILRWSHIVGQFGSEVKPVFFCLFVLAQQIVGDFAPVGDPDLIPELLDVADHAFDRAGKVWPAPQFGVGDDVDIARPPAKGLFIQKIEGLLEPGDEVVAIAKPRYDVDVPYDGPPLAPGLFGAGPLYARKVRRVEGTIQPTFPR